MDKADIEISTAVTPEEITKLYKSPPASKFLPGEDGKLDKTQANPNYVPLSKADRTAAVKYTMNYNYSGPTKQAYTYIYNEINKRLSGDSPDKEYNFIKTVTDGVVHHATLGEDV